MPRRGRKWLNVLLALGALLALSQAPFIYRRHRLARLDTTIRGLNAQRAARDDAGRFGYGDRADYGDYAGALHVHTSLGGHSTGTLKDVVEGAKSAGLAFVVMTEHPSGLTDTRAATLSGTHDGVLFVPGNETNESLRDRLLTFGGAPAGDVNATGTPTNWEGAQPQTYNATPTPPASPASTQTLIDRAKADGRLVFVAHPETFESWATARGFDGMEVYNLHADARHVRPVKLFFDGLWSYRSFPHLLWTSFSETPTENLRRWDELTSQGRRVVAVAGNDAHANVGVSLQDLTGKPLFQIKLDPYARSFGVVRTHALVPRTDAFDAATLVAALANGHAYVAFDVLCDATGFRLSATNGTEQILMGDEIALGAGVRLRVATPVESRIVLIKDGRKSDEKVATGNEWAINEKGVYRVECYLPQLPAPLDQKPWIISNPVYVR